MSHGSAEPEFLVRSEQAEEIEVQCQECYRIFTTNGSLGAVECEACGSPNLVKW